MMSEPTFYSLDEIGRQSASCAVSYNQRASLRLDEDITSIAVDAEWCNNKFLCVQLAASDNEGKIKNLYVFTDDVLSIKHCPDLYKGIPVTRVIYPIGEKSILEYFKVIPKSLICYFFYSPRDIEALLGKDKLKEMMVTYC